MMFRECVSRVGFGFRLKHVLMMAIFLVAETAVSMSPIGATFAADMAPRSYIKAPTPVAAVYDWTGFYLGINGGGGATHTCWDLTNNAGTPVTPPQAEGCHNATGGTVGGQVGYRWQAASWVFGAEAQGNWAEFNGSNVNPLFLGRITNLSKVRGFGLFTGQIGYAVNNVLFYAKGGAAVTREAYNNTLTALDLTVSEGSETRWGGVFGAGIEAGFAPNWSVAAEYDHLFMGTKSVTLNTVPPLPPGLSGIHNIRQDVDIGTVRLNYRFGGPLVAKY